MEFKADFILIAQFDGVQGRLFSVTQLAGRKLGFLAWKEVR